jgi:hypothetical protein
VKSTVELKAQKCDQRAVSTGDYQKAQDLIKVIGLATCISQIPFELGLIRAFGQAGPPTDTLDLQAQVSKAHSVVSIHYPLVVQGKDQRFLESSWTTPRQLVSSASGSVS